MFAYLAPQGLLQHIQQRLTGLFKLPVCGREIWLDNRRHHACHECVLKRDFGPFSSSGNRAQARRIREFIEEGYARLRKDGEVSAMPPKNTCPDSEESENASSFTEESADNQLVFWTDKGMLHAAVIWLKADGARMSPSPSATRHHAEENAQCNEHSTEPKQTVESQGNLSNGVESPNRGKRQSIERSHPLQSAGCKKRFSGLACCMPFLSRKHPLQAGSPKPPETLQISAQSPEPPTAAEEKGEKGSEGRKQKRSKDVAAKPEHETNRTAGDTSNAPDYARSAEKVAHEGAEIKLPDGGVGETKLHGSVQEEKTNSDRPEEEPHEDSRAAVSSHSLNHVCEAEPAVEGSTQIEQNSVTLAAKQLVADLIKKASFSVCEGKGGNSSSRHAEVPALQLDKRLENGDTPLKMMGVSASQDNQRARGE
ncbi:hypothetical protein BESB_028680 [Besnoitia besnoiti]|uniref:Uncharacterized protein n=1 Tax=Besnoitia besnoiti TaxID=94643 RepID=A0A2A9M718_BESBE|nr:uncharacterized protein BESB_028680 [Besnoitia besnoiti]PFH31433.1 hypothetical protein BESB_028680 [Besnoitia besnoiti]